MFYTLQPDPEQFLAAVSHYQSQAAAVKLCPPSVPKEDLG